MKQKHIVFTGGGTLGHVMPNIFLIRDLKADYEISYIGTNGMEKEKVLSEIKNYFTIPAVKFERGKIFVNLKIPFVLINAVNKAKKILKNIKPDLIFSKGGYVSLPVCIAGRMLKIPIIANESDFSFGLANKVILKLCDKMTVNFKHLENVNKKVVYTGAILSREFENNEKITKNLNLDASKTTILVVGGSLGSQKINDILFACLKDLLVNFNIIHITGKGNLKLKAYDNYNAFEIVSDMNNLYNIADFVLGRSGAGVTSECFFKSLPMLLVPLENKASRGDQLQNAKFYSDLGVARIIREADLTPTKLLDEIYSFNKNLSNYKANYQHKEQPNGRLAVERLINNMIEEK